MSISQDAMEQEAILKDNEPNSSKIFYKSLHTEDFDSDDSMRDPDFSLSAHTESYDELDKMGDQIDNNLSQTTTERHSNTKKEIKQKRNNSEAYVTQTVQTMCLQLNAATFKDLKMIEYPGLIKNKDTMIETLGGSAKISQAFCGEIKRLELYFHPKNQFNKPAYAETSPKIGLLLSIQIRKSKKYRQISQYRVEIVGHCKSSFVFDSLCDFQYLPINTNSKGNAEFIMESLVPRKVTDAAYFSLPNVPLLCLPHVFARSDTVPYNIFRNDAHEDGQNETLGVIQKSSYESRDMVQFNMIDVFPSRPDAHVVKRMKVKYVSDEQLEKVKKLFDDCPVWTRIALLYESGVSNDKLKCIIPSLAYYFSNGPWRTLYVRYGYDPRKDFNSRCYQTFDFRLRFRSGVAELVDRRRVRKQQKSDIEETNSIVQDVDYPYFEENKLPRSRQCILRYSDIRMRKVQEMLDKIPSPMTGATCSERTGWLPVGFDAQVRQILTNVIKDLMRKHSRQEQEQTSLIYSDNANDSEENEHEMESDLSDEMAENIMDLLQV